MGALDGIKVIDLSRLLPGAFCSTMLADHGADVTVVEAPRFRENQVIGVVPMVRRNKRHIALDLSAESGKKIFYELVAQADVLIEGFRPGVATKLGLDYESICKVNPRRRLLLDYRVWSGWALTAKGRSRHELHGVSRHTRPTERRAWGAHPA